MECLCQVVELEKYILSIVEAPLEPLLVGIMNDGAGSYAIIVGTSVGGVELFGSKDKLGRELLVLMQQSLREA